MISSSIHVVKIIDALKSDLNHLKKELDNKYIALDSLILEIEKHNNLNELDTEIADFKQIILIIAQVFFIEPSCIYMKSNKPEYSIPRNIAIYITKKQIPLMAYKKMAKVLDGRNHSTMLNSMRVIVNEMDTNILVKSKYDEAMILVNDYFKHKNQ